MRYSADKMQLTKENMVKIEILDKIYSGSIALIP